MNSTLLPQALPGFPALSRVTGYPVFTLRTAKHDARLPVRIVGCIGPVLMFNRRDAERLAAAHPAKLTKALHRKLTEEQTPA